MATLPRSCWRVGGEEVTSPGSTTASIASRSVCCGGRQPLHSGCLPYGGCGDDIRELAETNRDSTILLVNPLGPCGEHHRDLALERREAEALGQFQSIYSLAEADR